VHDMVCFNWYVQENKPGPTLNPGLACLCIQSLRHQLPPFLSGHVRRATVPDTRWLWALRLQSLSCCIDPGVDPAGLLACTGRCQWPVHYPLTPEGAYRAEYVHIR
jgi:hypothetical protein